MYIYLIHYDRENERTNERKKERKFEYKENKSLCHRLRLNGPYSITKIRSQLSNYSRFNLPQSQCTTTISTFLYNSLTFEYS